MLVLDSIPLDRHVDGERGCRDSKCEPAYPVINQDVLQTCAPDKAMEVMVFRKKDSLIHPTYICG